VMALAKTAIAARPAHTDSAAANLAPLKQAA